jgi:TetR/AcrR family transcriptional repressor of mexJK operon
VPGERIGPPSMSPSIKSPAVKPRAPGRPTQRDSTELRERILDVALEEFLTRGFGAASIEGIARAAGVNKDTIYRQYGGKERLYRKCVLRTFETAPRGSRATFDLNGDVERTLASVMRRMHRTLTTPRALAVMSMTITQAAIFPDLAAAARADTLEYLRPLAGYLRALKRDGVLHLDDPDDAAEMLVSNALGGTRFMYEPPLRGKPLAEFVERRLGILLRGWRFRPAVVAHN